MALAHGAPMPARARRGGAGASDDALPTTSGGGTQAQKSRLGDAAVPGEAAAALRDHPISLTRGPRSARSHRRSRTRRQTLWARGCLQRRECCVDSISLFISNQRLQRARNSGWMVGPPLLTSPLSSHSIHQRPVPLPSCIGFYAKPSLFPPEVTRPPFSVWGRGMPIALRAA